jgi:hypothetical protein
MAIQTAAMRNILCTAYANQLAGQTAGTAAVYAALYTTAPGGSAGTEPSGGSPAYARKLISWGAASGSVITGTCTFDLPSGTTIVGGGVHTAVTAGTYLDGGALTSQAFASQGTYALTLTYTQA